MSADKLILISRAVKQEFEALAKWNGQARSGFAHFVDLQRSEFKLPAHLYCGGFWNGISKIEFIDVATLGLHRVEQITGLICPNPSAVKISRIDWAVDVLGWPAWQVAACCHVDRVVNCALYRSRTGVTFYPHKSIGRTIVIYERGKRLLSQHHPLSQVYGNDDLTRIEVQFRGKGVPIREFARIREYANFNVLHGVIFEKLLSIPKGLKPIKLLGAERLHSLVHEVGLQNASKRFSPSEWSYLRKTFFGPTTEEFPDIHAMMKKSVIDWLENRLRFPRS